MCLLNLMLNVLIFLSTLREEGDCPVRVGDLRDIEISIHAPRGGRLQTSCDSSQATNFYPRSARRATTSAHRNALSWVFLSTPPRGGDGRSVISAIKQKLFLSTPPRGGRRQARSGRQVAQDISIHAPRGGRLYRSDCSCRCSNFYPRLREEGDGSFSQFILDLDTFLSTPPRGGRPTVLRAVVPHDGISIHAPRGGRLGWWPTSATSSVISIHASARRATSSACRPADAGRHFYPRLREEGDRVGCRTPAP